jgi:hypothetical protein
MPPGLGEILAESGDLTLRRLRRASDWRRVHGGTIDRALLATGAVSEETLLDALARLTGLPSVSRERLDAASREAVETLPPEARRRLRALPFDRRGDVLHVAVVDPGNPVLETGLIASTGCDIRLHVTADPILDDVLRTWEPARPDPLQEPAVQAPAAPPQSPPPESPPAPRSAPSRDRLEPFVDPDPFARLARALLIDALDEGAQAVEIGPEGKGALLRTFSGGLSLSSRPLPRPVLEPLLAWFLARSRPSGPFDEEGLVLERARRRVRVGVTVDGAGTAWLVLEPEPARALPAGAAEICVHDGGTEEDIFCPACGAPL